MGTVSVSLPSDGQTIDAADYNVPINTIVAEINGGLDSANIEAGGVVPNGLVSGTGTSWAWSSYSPTLSGLFTNGDWTVNGCSYIQIGKTVIVKVVLVATDSTPMGGAGDATFTLPVTSVAVANAGVQLGTLRLRDANGSIYIASVFHASTTTATIKSTAVSGANTIEAALSSTAPFTWTTSDGVLGTIIYEAA